MEITTILMIVFSVVLVVALILYFWPVFRKMSSKNNEKKSKKDKKIKKSKKDDYDDMVIYRGDANAENNKVGLEEEPAPELDKTAQLEKELDSIKNYLKIPPPESAMNGEISVNNNQNINPYANPWGMTMPPQQNNNPWMMINDNYDNSQIRLPSLEERYEEKLWDDDLSKRLYIDDQLEEKPQPYNPYLVRREKSIKDELSNLSPQMKKILISDMLKKKNH